MKTKIFALLAVLMIGLTVSCQKNEKEDMMDPSPAEKARLLSSDPCSYPGNGTIKPLTVGYNTEQLSPGKYQWRRKISKNTLNNFRFYVEVIDGGDVTTRSVFYKKKNTFEVKDPCLTITSGYSREFPAFDNDDNPDDWDYIFYEIILSEPSMVYWNWSPR